VLDLLLARAHKLLGKLIQMGLALAGITKAIAITPKQIEWEIHTVTIAEAIPLTLIRVNQETSMAGIARAIASGAIRIGKATATRMKTKVIAETVKKWVPLLTATEVNRATCYTFVEHFHLCGSKRLMRIKTERQMTRRHQSVWFLLQLAWSFVESRQRDTTRIWLSNRHENL